MTRAPWIADVLRAAGLNVVEQPGWETRGKDFVSIDGHMAHHTASPKTSTLAVNLSVVTNGNAVAPGPIANVLLWRDGTYYVIASGRCNHAGKGVLPWVAQDQGNTHLLSTEAVNDGIGELWAPAMVEAYEIGTAAMLRHLGLDSSRATTHAEYAPTRKIDPAGPTGGRIATLPGRSTWLPVSWRERIADRLRPPPPIVDPDPLEDTRVNAVVGLEENHSDPRRWVWNGASMRLLRSEAEFDHLRLIFPFHSNWNTLASPYWMTQADIDWFTA